MKENGTHTLRSVTDVDTKSGAMAVYMKGIGKQTKLMAVVDSYTQMATSMMGTGAMIKHTDLDSTLTPTAHSMKATG